MRILAIICVLVWASSGKLCAQAPQAGAPAAEIQPPYRSPATARVLGMLLPGAGHIYAGEYATGVRSYYGTVCGIGGGALAFVVGGMASEAHDTGWPLQVSGVLLVGLGLRVWIRSSLDAPRAAARANAKHRQAAAPLSLILRRGAEGSQSNNVGVAVAW